MSEAARGLLLAALLAVAPPAVAQAGTADADFERAFELMGSKAPADQTRARELMKAASDAGNVEARNGYATMLTMGIGGPKDARRARRLREEAAAAGSEGANLTLMELHLAGAEGYPRDAGKAYGFARAAADSPLASPTRHCFAQWKVGMMTLAGTGTAKDAAAAYGWVKRAAGNGCANGLISQAAMLATGDGVAEDDVAARALYARASESGDRNFGHALRGLAGMMLAGEGGPVDAATGFGYLMIAKAAGDANADRLLTIHAAAFTPDVRAQGIEISKRWMAEHMRR